MKRRKLLCACGLGVLGSSAHRIGLSESISHKTGPITQPSRPTKKAFIERAFKMRSLAIESGDQSYGAIVVLDNVIVGQSWSRVIIDQDPTAHAEVSAIRDAAKRTKSRNLEGATLFSSSSPCPMCEAAAYWAGIQKMIYGQQAVDGGSPQLCG